MPDKKTIDRRSFVTATALAATGMASVASAQTPGRRVARIAAAQLRRDGTGDRTPVALAEYRRQRMEPMIEEAALQDVDILCFCEAEITRGLQADSTDRSAYENATSGLTAKWAMRLAKRFDINLVVPIEAFHRGHLRNTALVIGRDGRLAGVYEKVHPTNGEKKKGIVPGDSFPVFDLPLKGAQSVKIGVMICHDLSYVESTRCLALAGAEIVFWPSLWSGWGDELNYILIKSRAIDNAIYLMHVSLAPPEGREWVPNSLMARSGVFNPYGMRLCNAGFQPGLAVCNADLTAPVRVAPYYTNGEHDDYRAWMLHERRPDVYSNLADESLVRPKPAAD